MNELNAFKFLSNTVFRRVKKLFRKKKTFELNDDKVFNNISKPSDVSPAGMSVWRSAQFDPELRRLLNQKVVLNYIHQQKAYEDVEDSIEEGYMGIAISFGYMTVIQLIRII